MNSSNSSQSMKAWRYIWISLLMLALVALLLTLKQGASLQVVAIVRTLVSLFLLVAWVVSIRFLMLRTWGRVFWLLVLVGSLIITPMWGKSGMILGLLMSGLFLFTRFYHPWRLVPARRRAQGFGLGILALVVLFWSSGMWGTEAEESSLAALDKLGILSLGSLLVFWSLSLFHLAVRMRLHFLRLRAKLAANAVLIGFVPMVLIVALGLYTFYYGMGGARAQRSANIMNSWASLAAGGNDLTGAPFDTTFVWPNSDVSLPDTSQILITAPLWVTSLSELLPEDPGMIAVSDTTSFFLAQKRIWLMRWQNLGQSDVETRAWLVNERPLKELSFLVKAGVELTEIDGFVRGAGLKVDDDDDRFSINLQSMAVSHRDISGDSTFWHPLRSFGVAFFPVMSLDEDGLGESNILLNLGIGWGDMKAEFLEGENNLNVVAVVIIVLISCLFFVIELFAVFFGVRITEGFVAAVHSLHKGTRALAQGNLDTVITIPNEDEFGDLADSFNEMTVALRQGRKDALAKEALTLELATAREIQERLLPSSEPSLSGFEVTGASIPSREVGGDYFDFIIQDQDHVGIAIGDVSGKGMPAALLMSNLQASLHGQVIHPSSVSQVVGLVNNLLVASTDPHMFATFFYGQLNTSLGAFTSTNAGHNPPLILRTDGSMEYLKAGGLLLGMLPDQDYKQETVNLEPGDVVVLYTDGITEAVGPGIDEDDVDAMFGEDALEDVVIANSHLPAVGIKEAILDAVSRHTDGVAQSDDITLVVIRRLGLVSI